MRRPPSGPGNMTADHSLPDLHRSADRCDHHQEPRRRPGPTRGGQEADHRSLGDGPLADRGPPPYLSLFLSSDGSRQEGAYADVVVKLGTYIKLLQKRFDVCEELSVVRLDRSG